MTMEKMGNRLEFFKASILVSGINNKAMCNLEYIMNSNGLGELRILELVTQRL